MLLIGIDVVLGQLMLVAELGAIQMINVREQDVRERIAEITSAGLDNRASNAT